MKYRNLGYELLSLGLFHFLLSLCMYSWRSRGRWGFRSRRSRDKFLLTAAVPILDMHIITDWDYEPEKKIIEVLIPFVYFLFLMGAASTSLLPVTKKDLQSSIFMEAFAPDKICGSGRSAVTTQERVMEAQSSTCFSKGQCKLMDRFLLLSPFCMISSMLQLKDDLL